jgi:hypothetical protein
MGVVAYVKRGTESPFVHHLSVSGNGRTFVTMATSNCQVAVYINPDSGRFRMLEMQLQLFVSGGYHKLTHACMHV